MDKNALIKALEEKRNYINSLEPMFSDENQYGFGPFIQDLHNEMPDSDFYDLTMDDFYQKDAEPLTDFEGNLVTIDPNKADMNKQIEEYLYNWLLNNNNYD